VQNWCLRHNALSTRMATEILQGNRVPHCRQTQLKECKSAKGCAHVLTIHASSQATGLHLSRGNDGQQVWLPATTLYAGEPTEEENQTR
jgi:hypothetical protein